MSKNQYKRTKKPSFSLKRIKSGDCVIGVDEAGRGAWAGPVVAACVIWSGKNPIKWILRDSKKMTEKDREKTYEEIISLAAQGKILYWVGIIENTVIDEVWIREANRRAMEGALRMINTEKIKENKGGIFLLIDGRDNYVFDAPGLPEPEYIVRGDSRVKQIMAASVLAKVTRDRIMIEYEKTFPGYGFDKHKWYGTGVHQEALKNLWVSQIHRKSYAPIKNLLSQRL